MKNGGKEWEYQTRHYCSNSLKTINDKSKPKKYLGCFSKQFRSDPDTFDEENKQDKVNERKHSQDYSEAQPNFSNFHVLRIIESELLHQA